MGLTQDVRVWTRTQTGTDAMGDPTYAWSFADVSGVLVKSGPADGATRGDVADGLRPDAVRVAYTLAFPRGYSGPPLRHARVTLLDPMYGMDLDESDGWRDALVVSGDPRPAVRPTRWDMVAEVGRTDG